MVQTIKEQLLEVLQKVDRPSTFCTSGYLPSIHPGLEVSGLGPVALPLEQSQADALRKLARQAPYGKGTKTLVDTDVRRVWEIDADQVVLANPEWPGLLKEALRVSQHELGLQKQELEAHLYKLLLYQPGSFFLAHRDGEKLDRMVATLVIVLPSVHEGGELVVRHEGHEEIVNFAAESRFKIQFAAFYADCEHEIRNVTSGRRLALVYNLALQKSKQTVMAPTSHEHIAAVDRILRTWNTERPTQSHSNNESFPTKLAVLLDHRYTRAGLTRDTLKGIDRAKADVLFAAARESGFDASLALVTYWASGSAEPTGGYGYGYGRSRRRYDDEDDEDHSGGQYYMGEVIDESLTAKYFSDAVGNPLAFGEIPLEDEEIVSDLPIDEQEPDKEDFEGYTGNAGMTLERWYHRAAILLWPAESRFDVLCEAGVGAAIGGLDQMVQKWKQADQADRATLKESCLAFASRIVAVWQEQISKYGRAHAYDASAGRDDENEWDDDEWEDEDEDDGDENDAFDQDDIDEEAEDDFDEQEDGEGDGADELDREIVVEPKPTRRTFLALLNDLGDVSLISDWLRGVLLKDASIHPGEELGDVCQRYGWRTFEAEFRELFDSTSNETLERHAQLLADWTLRQDADSDRRQLCIELAQSLMAAVERWDPEQANQDWRAKKINRNVLLPPLIQSFLALDQPELLERLVTYVLDRPKEFDLTSIQVPVFVDVSTWLNSNIYRAVPSLDRWLRAILGQLEFRASQPPQEPTDWRRESETGCNCADCKQLGRFLQNPTLKTIRLPLAEHRRQHLHQIIDRMLLDTTHDTERRGRPYSLICTKTKGSYERAVKAHQLDLDQLARIRALLEWHAGLSAETKSSGRTKSGFKKRRSARP